MIDFTQLEYLKAFVEAGTLTGAADKVHVSQSALSRSMRKLEEELQVALFTRTKNKLSLNDNGKLAAKYAEKILDDVNLMATEIRNFDLAKKTIAVGSCAPAPLWDVLPQLAVLYPEMKITSQLDDFKKLEQGLLDEKYQMIILPYVPKREDLNYLKLMDEKLFFALPADHPLASKKALHFKEADGETFLLYSQIGFWKKLTYKKLPHSKFIVQEDSFAMNELVKNSTLPSFVTDVSIKNGHLPKNKIAVPIVDEDVSVTYYAICLKGRSWRLLERFMNNRLQTQA